MNYIHFQAFLFLDKILPNFNKPFLVIDHNMKYQPDFIPTIFSSNKPVNIAKYENANH